MQEFDLIPGTVPPFGSVLGVRTFVDNAITERKELAFNIGLLTESIIEFDVQDYLHFEDNAEVVDIAA